MLSDTIEKLIAYGKIHLGLDVEDAIYVRNLLLREFKQEKPSEITPDFEHLKSLSVPDELTSELKEAIVSELGKEEGEAERDVCYAMGLISPLPSTVNATFSGLYQVSPKEATDYLYDLSIHNDYVQKTKVDRNIVWDAHYEDGPDLEISINLSKPEKNNKDIAKLLKSVSSTYPKCMLCHENLGFAGNDRKPPRETLRVIPITLDDEQWYLQYSPYGYYDEHCILFFEEHVPMEINKRILSKLFAFVDLFPHYFVGSNSDLPIVGGSILDHEHFQGGLHLMPCMRAKPKMFFETPNHKDVKLALLDFYDTVLEITGTDREKVLSLADDVTLAWRKFDKPELSLISHDEEGQHSTVTPIVRKEGETYHCYLILRNNKTSQEYPDGIYHAHPEHHMIKKEGIGLIEAMGRFILPARLKRQLSQIEDIVENGLSEKEYLGKYTDMVDFKAMIDDLKASGKPVRSYVDWTCQDILRNVAVFKEDEAGREGLNEFIKGANL